MHRFLACPTTRWSRPATTATAALATAGAHRLVASSSASPAAIFTGGIRRCFTSLGHSAATAASSSVVCRRCTAHRLTNIAPPQRLLFTRAALQRSSHGSSSNHDENANDDEDDHEDHDEDFEEEIDGFDEEENEVGESNLDVILRQAAEVDVYEKLFREADEAISAREGAASGESAQSNNESNHDGLNGGSGSSSSPTDAVKALSDPWAVDEFSPIMLGSMFSQSSSTIPPAKDVLFIALQSSMINMPGQALSIALPASVMETLRTQHRIASLKARQVAGEPKKLLVGLFFQKSSADIKAMKEKAKKEKEAAAAATKTAADNASSSLKELPAHATTSDAAESKSTDATRSTDTTPSTESTASSTSSVSDKSSSALTTTRPSPPPLDSSGTFVDLSVFEPVGLLAEIVFADNPGPYVYVLCHRRIMMDTSSGTAISAYHPNLRVNITHHEDLTVAQLKKAALAASAASTATLGIPPPPTVAQPISDEDKAAADALKLEGNTLLTQRDAEAALEKFTEAMRLNPLHAIYPANRAAAHLFLRHCRAAAADCRLSIALDPTYPKAYYRLGRSLAELGDHAGALVAYREALARVTTEGEATRASIREHIATCESKLAAQQEGVIPLTSMGEFIELKNECLKLLRSLRQLEGPSAFFAARQKTYFYFDPQSPGRIIDFWSTLASASSYNSEVAFSASASSLVLDQQTSRWMRETLTSRDLVARLRAVRALLTQELAVVRKQKAIDAAARQKLDADRLALLLEQKRQVEQKMRQLELPASTPDAEGATTSESTEGTIPGGAPADRRTEKERVLDRFTERLKSKTVPADVLTVIDEEMEKFRSMDAENSFEYSNVRNYLDWLTQLPWNTFSPERYDIKRAESVLKEDHYGMEDVKNRILEFIATSKLVGTVPQGRILCLVGPPGVGKTSIGKSIARALDRKFYRFSVGGMDDVSEIKGHRRTYVGSMPGKLLQALKRVEVSNPVILIDEIDKLGRGGHRGDPASALLEVLDPEQNSTFMDHYLDVPVDLSKVLFICTANDRDTIPGPLADRMDFIELSGYLAAEKVSIAHQYLEPVIRERTGVTAEQLTIQEDALFHLIRWYCREAGVRSLQKYLEKIYRKVALKIARETKRLEKAKAAAATASTDAESTVAATIATPTSSALAPIVITPANLAEYAGPPNFISDKLYDVNPVGVATGLAYTSHGGAVLFLESAIADVTGISRIPRMTALDPTAPVKDEHGNANDEEEDDLNPTKSDYGGHGELFCTGQLGAVMKESSSIAYTVAKRVLAQHTSPHSIHRHFFNQHRIHLHFPTGAIPKDGPSAGIAMVTSLLSLALDTPPIQGHAMTGELTLTGRVLPIGGVKEKLMAAKHAGITLVLLPVDNKKDVAELKNYVTEGLDIRYVKTYDEVFEAIFPHFKDIIEGPTSPATAQLPTPSRSRAKASNATA